MGEIELHIPSTPILLILFVHGRRLRRRRRLRSGTNALWSRAYWYHGGLSRYSCSMGAKINEITFTVLLPDEIIWYASVHAVGVDCPHRRRRKKFLGLTVDGRVRHDATKAKTRVEI
ncbi:MAG: hypothetical protein H0A76_12655 [Candidatus Thiodubiliella endoseptemdiera]|uniref:Uncharacterized protein n=1 Tax=Candidatus Thiodubiliella endoseptemdiera TaxID=2738886 RepID=A0A853F4P6_9GAMM|nr:hypothetical protein [Candidatus Thiodubiliella endoseptemdiera]